MLDPALVRDHLAEVDTRLRPRGLDPSKDLAVLARLEAELRPLNPSVEKLQPEQKAASEAVARAKKEGHGPSAIFAENKARAARIRDLETALADVERQRDARLLTLPNLPHESVPAG